MFSVSAINIAIASYKLRMSTNCTQIRVGDTVQLTDGSKAGQVHELVGSNEVKILFQGAAELATIDLSQVELAPKRFGGLLTKYSRNGRLVRNWKDRWFEVWSDSITYREADRTEVLGGIVLSPRSEIISDSIISQRKDRFTGDPPHKYFCGIYNDKRTMWVSSPSEELMNKFKLDVQQAINESITRDPSEVVSIASGKRSSKCSIQ